MAGLIFTYVALFALAIGGGFVLGAGLQRSNASRLLADLDGDVEALKARLAAARGSRDEMA